jgi:hypothetical protein
MMVYLRFQAASELCQTPRGSLKTNPFNKKPFSSIPNDLTFSGCLYRLPTKKHRYAW